MSQAKYLDPKNARPPSRKKLAEASAPEVAKGVAVSRLQFGTKSLVRYPMRSAGQLTRPRYAVCF